MSRLSVSFLSICKKIAVVIIFALLIMLAKYVLFSESRPASNSEEYLVQHGIKKGWENELIIRGVALKFPAGYPVNPYTDRDKNIVKGRADSVETSIDVNSDKFMPPKYASGTVQIRISDKGSEDSESLADYLKYTTKGAGSKVENLELNNYITAGRGGWANLILEPFDGTKTPMGGRIIFSCNGKSLSSPGGCRTSYQHSSGLLVEYFFSGYSLSRWKEINSQVVSFVDSITLRREI
ncbi:hypothetical protein [Pseudomonas turukhanskensis]|uniref:Uncharacterized protein n=1 Tax=Pseudomonas turukhanskensis TaxID=1806536 RepID=A0A9W6K9I9_9PSED|nr:hypothetical protein [Pseudomonas turukhanskensis]GLK91232.1 hypothetical protein GCM10017655_42960 [Pseudomonas turukhanskensis]